MLICQKWHHSTTEMHTAVICREAAAGCTSQVADCSNNELILDLVHYSSSVALALVHRLDQIES